MSFAARGQGPAGGRALWGPFGRNGSAQAPVADGGWDWWLPLRGSRAYATIASMVPADHPAACQPVPREPAEAQGLPSRLGIMGGTFDPIHNAHLFIAEQAREQLGLPLVLFVPSAQPPHKLADPLTAAEHRLAMTELAVAGNGAFAVSRLELDRPGPSYTVETLRALRSSGVSEPHLIVGADSVLEMGTWYQHEAIWREARVVAVARDGYDLDRLPRALGEERARQVLVVRAPLLDISSTDIRQRLRAGRSVRYLVPEVVEQYIMQQGLYRSGGGA